jgi:hypothetical protein
MVAVATAAAAAAAAGGTDVPAEGMVESPSDLPSMYDMLHCRLLLERIAANAVAAADAESAAGGQATGQSPSAQQPSSSSGSGGGRAAAVVQTGVQHLKLKHQDLLQLDLHQLQQLLLWVVLGPSCRGQGQLSAAADALGDLFLAEALGVREQQERLSGVQVVGAHFADTLELAARCRQQQQQQQRRIFEQQQQVLNRESAGMSHKVGHGVVQQDSSSRSGNVGSGVFLRRSSSCSDGDGEGSGVVMPLGLCLGLKDLCDVLQKRLG